MAARPKKAKTAPRAGFASLALRTTGVRVGLGVALVAGAAGLYALKGRQPQVAVQAPPPVAVAAAKPAPAPAPAAPEEPAPQPPHRGVTFDDAKPMSAAMRAAFDSWLMGAYAKCWKAPKTLPDGEPYLPKVRVAFKEDGELAAPPRLVNPPSDPAWKAHAEAALKAVKGCDPLHVPDKYAEYYPSWKSRTVYFDPARN